MLHNGLARRSFNISSVLCRNLATKVNTRPLPKCIYVQPPIQWLKCKLNFQRLKMWDGNFDEKEFRRGAKQASLVLLNDVVRARDSVLLSKVATLKGFTQIYRDMLASTNDPRRKLLYLTPDDIHRIIPVDVAINESDKECHCQVEVFFMAMKFLDEIIKMYQKSNRNVNLQIYQDIKKVESLVKKENYKERGYVPPDEKLLVLEGYMTLYSNYSAFNGSQEWKVNFFKISEFNIVHIK